MFYLEKHLAMCWCFKEPKSGNVGLTNFSFSK